MKSISKITNFTSLSYSVVLVWKSPLNSLPPLAPEFFKGIFGSNVNTVYTLGRNGIVVNEGTVVSPLNGPIPAISPPALHFGFDRLVLAHTDKAALLNAYQLLEQEMFKISFDPMLAAGQMGINIEYEIEFDEGNSYEYLNKRFGAPEDQSLFPASLITEIKLTIVETSDNSKLINLGLQSRNGNDKAFFMTVNDHFGHVKNQTFIKVEELLSYIDESESKLSNKVVPYLNLLENGK